MYFYTFKCTYLFLILVINGQFLSTINFSKEESTFFFVGGRFVT